MRTAANRERARDRTLGRRETLGRNLGANRAGVQPSYRRGDRASAAGVEGRRASRRNRGTGRFRRMAPSLAYQASISAVRVPRVGRARKDDIARIITAQHGKVHADALGEVGRGLEVVDFACGLPHLLKGGYSEQVSTDVDVFSIRQPVGVCAGITPFNFPAMVPMWMFPVAIACGERVRAEAERARSRRVAPVG